MQPENVEAQSRYRTRSGADERRRRYAAGSRSRRCRAKGVLQMTGQMGDVMKESAQIALTVRSVAS